MFVFNILNDASPVYFAEHSHVHRTNEFAKMVAKKTTGGQAFTFVAPKLWDDFTAARSGVIEIFFLKIYSDLFLSASLLRLQFFKNLSLYFNNKIYVKQFRQSRLLTLTYETFWKPVLQTMEPN